MKQRGIKQIWTSLGELVSDLGKEEEGEVRHASLELLQMDFALHLRFLWPSVANMEHCSIHSTTYLACKNVDHER